MLKERLLSLFVENGQSIVTIVQIRPTISGLLLLEREKISFVTIQYKVLCPIIVYRLTFKLFVSQMSVVYLYAYLRE